MEIFTKSAEETYQFGEKIGTYLKKQPTRETAQIILLQGELGSGKTTCMQGIAKGMSIGGRLVSPTYIIIKEYEIENENYKKLYHIDLYRLTQKTEVDIQQLNDIFANQKAIVVIEWPERLDRLPPYLLYLQFTVVGDSRRITSNKDISL